MSRLCGRTSKQRGERVAGRGCDQVVVVDHEVELWAAPPGAVAELGLGDVGAGQALAHRLGGVFGQLGRGGGGRAVADQVVAAGGLEQGTAVVDDDQPGLRRGVPAGDAVGQDAEQVGLARGGVAEDQEVRIGRELRRHQPEIVLGYGGAGRSGARGERRNDVPDHQPGR